MLVISEDLCHEFDSFDRSDSQFIDNRQSRIPNQIQSITPWNTSPQHNKISNTQQFHMKKNFQTNQQSCTSKRRLSQNTYGFSKNTKKKLSNLQSQRKQLYQSRNHQYRFNLKNIEFLKYQKYQLINQNYNLNLFSSKIASQDSPIFQKSFQIKKYFLPSNNTIKSIKKDLSKSELKSKKFNDVPGPSFIAIKSLDLQEKITIKNQDEKDSEQQINPKAEKPKTAYRTISMLDQRKSKQAKNQSMQENYNNSISLNDQEYKTIDSTIYSSKQMARSIKQKTFFTLDQHFYNETFLNSERNSRNLHFAKTRKPKMTIQNDAATLNFNYQKNNSEKDKNVVSQEMQMLEYLEIKKKQTQSRQKLNKTEILKYLKQRNELSNLFNDEPPFISEKNKELLLQKESEIIKKQLKQKSIRNSTPNGKHKKIILQITQKADMKKTFRKFYESDSFQDKKKHLKKVLHKKFLIKDHKNFKN